MNNGWWTGVIPSPPQPREKKKHFPEFAISLPAKQGIDNIMKTREKGETRVGKIHAFDVS